MAEQNESIQDQEGSPGNSVATVDEIYFYSLSDESFMDLIRSYPVIYNTSLKKYKDTSVRDNAFSEVAKVSLLKLTQLLYIYD